MSRGSPASRYDRCRPRWADGQQPAQLGTPYLRVGLDRLAELVDAVTLELTSPAADAHEATARSTAIHRRGLAVVVDLYKLAAVRNAQVRDGCKRAGWEVERPGLLLSETAEVAITILHEGLQRAAGLLEAAAPHLRLLSAGRAVLLLEHELAHARCDDDRFADAYRRAWAPPALADVAAERHRRGCRATARPRRHCRWLQVASHAARGKP